MTAGNPIWWLFGAIAFATLLPTASSTTVPERWAKLNDLHPQARSRFLALFLAIEAAGYKVVITSTWRPEGSDYHYFGLAVDFNIINMATGKWYRAADRFSKATWEATGIPELIRAHGFRWGGDFVTPWVYKGVTYPAYDPIHADLGKTYLISGLRARALLLAKTTPLAQFDGRKVPLNA